VSIPWVFLAGRRFTAKTVVYEGWIVLDFLGFSRPNRDLSMGYAEKARQIFFAALCLAFEAPGRATAVVAMRKGRIGHQVSLP
jgi:hypothetical protein